MPVFSINLTGDSREVLPLNPHYLTIPGTVALALAGDFSGASILVDDLKRRYPSDFQVNDVFVPSAQSLLLSSRGNTAAAIQALQPAARYELAPAFGFVPAYVRGVVYLRDHQGKEAAAEFQKILDHRSLGALPSILYLI